MISTISRSYSFSGAHRVEGHPKCGRLHGHNWKVTVHLTGDVQDDGMVIDFGKIDEFVKPLIDQLDHRYLVSKSNLQNDDPYYKASLGIRARNDDCILLPIPASTAEHLSRYFWDIITNYIPENVHVVRVEVQETERGIASYG